MSTPINELSEFQRYLTRYPCGPGGHAFDHLKASMAEGTGSLLESTFSTRAGLIMPCSRCEKRPEYCDVCDDYGVPREDGFLFSVNENAALSNVNLCQICWQVVEFQPECGYRLKTSEG